MGGQDGGEVGRVNGRRFSAAAAMDRRRGLVQEGKEERRTARRLECSTAQTTRRFAAPTFRGNIRLPLPLAQAARGRVVLDDRRRAPTATQSSRGCLRRKSPTLGQLRSSLSLSSPVLILARVHRVLTISSRGVRYERAKSTPMLSLPLRSSPVRPRRLPLLESLQAPS
jgi:hypothetical protein